MRRRPPGRNSVTTSAYSLSLLEVAAWSRSALRRTGSPGAVGTAAPPAAAAGLPHRRPDVGEVHRRRNDRDDAEDAERAGRVVPGEGAGQREQAERGRDGQDDQPQLLGQL